MSRAVEKIRDQDLVWQGFASCTSFAHSINDKIELIEKFSTDEANSFKCTLLALEINNLFVIFNEQIISWIIAIKNWYKEQNQTLLWHLCSVKTREIYDFIENMPAIAETIPNDVLEPYTFRLPVQTKGLIINDLKNYFQILLLNCLLGKNEKSKKLILATRQIHDKTKHGYILFDSNIYGSFFVPDKKYAEGVKVLSKDISMIEPVVVPNQMKLLKMLLNFTLLAIPLFQFIVNSYSVNRFGETTDISFNTLDKVKTDIANRLRQFVLDMMTLNEKKIDELMTILVSNFENGTLQTVDWSHSAHFNIATLYVWKYGKEKALEILREKSKKYDLSQGFMNPEINGYHETSTRFYLWAIDKYVVKGAQEFTFDLLDNLAKSGISNKDFPYEYYSKELLFSTKARFEWVEPDIKPLS